MARSARWARIPEQVLADGRITDVDLRVYAALAVSLHGRGYAPVPYSTLAQLSHHAVSTVRRSIARLVERGYVEALGGDPGAANEYALATFEDARMPGIVDPARNSEQTPVHLEEQTPARNGEQTPARNSEQTSGNRPEELLTLSTAASNPPARSCGQTPVHSCEQPSKRRDQDQILEDSSGDTPETPVPLANVQVIRWADICALVPAQWLRSDRHLKQLVQTLEDDAVRDPSHPWHGSMLVRSPETIGGWRILPDPDYLLPSPP